MRNLKKKVVVFATAASLAVVSMTGCASLKTQIQWQLLEGIRYRQELQILCEIPAGND